ncbi:hypothetical protein [Polymorphospora sp. NPDC050346]|uniref:hypothetical protein n=1 Tax=Polymorphospora sp. NPDC050346 TaxID=3155780 RepID=UPI003404D993
MVDVTVDGGPDLAHVRLRSPTWELNVRAPYAGLAGLRAIRDADWVARRSLRVGTCAGVPVHWAYADGSVAVLVGADDESWDVAVMVPVTVVDTIVAACAGGDGQKNSSRS